MMDEVDVRRKLWVIAGILIVISFILAIWIGVYAVRHRHPPFQMWYEGYRAKRTVNKYLSTLRKGKFDKYEYLDASIWLERLEWTGQDKVLDYEHLILQRWFDVNPRYYWS